MAYKNQLKTKFQVQDSFHLKKYFVLNKYSHIRDSELAAAIGFLENREKLHENELTEHQFDPFSYDTSAAVLVQGNRLQKRCPNPSSLLALPPPPKKIVINPTPCPPHSP